MGIRGKHLKDTKGKKWCPSALFPLLFKMLSLLLGLFVFPVLRWIKFNGVRRGNLSTSPSHTDDKGTGQADHT